MKNLLTLLLLIPSLSWGNEIYLDCRDRDMLNSPKVVPLKLHKSA